MRVAQVSLTIIELTSAGQFSLHENPFHIMKAIGTFMLSHYLDVLVIL